MSHPQVGDTYRCLRNVVGASHPFYESVLLKPGDTFVVDAVACLDRHEIVLWYCVPFAGQNFMPLRDCELVTDGDYTCPNFVLLHGHLSGCPYA